MDELYQGYVLRKSIDAMLYDVLFKVENISRNVLYIAAYPDRNHLETLSTLSTLLAIWSASALDCLDCWTAGKHPNPKRSKPPPLHPQRPPIRHWPPLACGLRLCNRSRRERRTHVNRASSLNLVHSRRHTTTFNVHVWQNMQPPLCQ